MTELAPRTSVIVPACNDADIVAPFVAGLGAAAPWQEILVIDDGSSDATAERAASAGARVIAHLHTKGHGAAIKSGLRHTRGEYVLITDPGAQHAPADAVTLVADLRDYDLVIGTRPRSGRTPLVQRTGHRFLNALASHLTGREIPDLTSGIRAARRACLDEFVHLIPNGFSTSTTTTLAFVKAGYSVRFVPVAPRTGTMDARHDPHGAPFFLILLKVITIFSPLKIFVPASITTFSLGAAYALWTIATESHVTNSSVLLILLSVVMFMLGLVSEQITALKFERPRP